MVLTLRECILCRRRTTRVTPPTGKTWFAERVAPISACRPNHSSMSYQACDNPKQTCNINSMSHTPFCQYSLYSRKIYQFNLLRVRFWFRVHQKWVTRDGVKQCKLIRVFLLVCRVWVLFQCTRNIADETLAAVTAEGAENICQTFKAG